MDSLTETDLRRRSVLLRSSADLRQLTVADGPGCGGRIVQARTPQGLFAEFALDRGGDLFSLSFRGMELGWHSAADAIVPWPNPDTEEGLGFLRGFDGFLVTCGLDHHGVAKTTPAENYRYPLRKRNHHPLHGRISGARAELVEKVIDWAEDEIRLRLILRQATVFGEVLELHRLWRLSLSDASIRLQDRVINRSFRPSRHGVLYHFNVGAPFLGPHLTASSPGWPPADDLALAPPQPADDHMEIVTVAASPESGLVRLDNPSVATAMELRFDARALPRLAMWRAYQSGVFALGIEPQTEFNGPDVDAIYLASGQQAVYNLGIFLGESFTPV